eukprot:4245542-Pyramimonas_sp.AAC.2
MMFAKTNRAKMRCGNQFRSEILKDVKGETFGDDVDCQLVLLNDVHDRPQVGLVGLMDSRTRCL